jgi:hypothetical protein
VCGGAKGRVRVLDVCVWGGGLRWLDQSRQQPTAPLSTCAWNSNIVNLRLEYEKCLVRS